MIQLRVFLELRVLAGGLRSWQVGVVDFTEGVLCSHVVVACVGVDGLGEERGRG